MVVCVTVILMVMMTVDRNDNVFVIAVNCS